jgi:hypothetical protein
VTSIFFIARREELGSAFPGWTKRGPAARLARPERQVNRMPAGAEHLRHFATNAPVWYEHVLGILNVVDKQRDPLRDVLRSPDGHMVIYTIVPSSMMRLAALDADGTHDVASEMLEAEDSLYVRDGWPAGACVELVAQLRALAAEAMDASDLALLHGGDFTSVYFLFERKE